jgi:hypothetical protein
MNVKTILRNVARHAYPLVLYKLHVINAQNSHKTAPGPNRAISRARNLGSHDKASNSNPGSRR